MMNDALSARTQSESPSEDWEGASRRVRAEGLNGAAVAVVMRDTGLTHGGFYKHFANKDELLLESLKEAFHDIGNTLVHAPEQSHPEPAWKAIVKTYLTLELWDRPEPPLSAAGTRPQIDAWSTRG